MMDDPTDALRTDEAIEALLGRGPEPTEADPGTVRVLRHLAVVHEAGVPEDLRERVAALTPSRRRLMVPRLLAAVLAGLFLLQGVPSFFDPAQLAKFLGLTLEPHIYREVGILAIALAAASLAAVVRPRLMAGVVTAIVPASLALGLFGLFEIGHSPNPGAEMLHIAQASVAVALGVAWWRCRP